MVRKVILERLYSSKSTETEDLLQNGQVLCPLATD